MEHIITRRRGFRKLLAFLLCMASILGLLPAQAFAMSVGQTASSWLGDQYVGSDGNHYRAPAPYTYLAYHADGTIDVHTSSGGNAYRHYMLTDSDGISHQVYCVESGIPYHTSENTYVSESGTNSQYLNLLPAEARRGIDQSGGRNAFGCSISSPDISQLNCCQVSCLTSVLLRGQRNRPCTSMRL